MCGVKARVDWKTRLILQPSMCGTLPAKTEVNSVIRQRELESAESYLRQHTASNQCAPYGGVAAQAAVPKRNLARFAMLML
jgi:hypothetical protein